MRRPSSAVPLVDFVLRHAKIITHLCSLQQHENGYKLERRTVPDYNLIYCTRGRPMWVIHEQPYPLEMGRLVIVPPGVPHHAFCKTRRVTIGSVHVEVTLPGGQDVFTLLIPPRLQTVAQGSRLDRYLRGAMDEFDRPGQDELRQMLSGWVRLIVLELIRQNAADGLIEVRDADPLVVELLDELNRRVAEPVTLNELAEWSGFSAQHLNRLFRRALGVTPLQHLARMRMERAAELLAEGRMTVRGLAQRVGYDDPYYFSRAFKQHFGQSPAYYIPSRHRQGSDSPS